MVVVGPRKAEKKAAGEGSQHPMRENIGYTHAWFNQNILRSLNIEN